MTTKIESIPSNQRSPSQEAPRFNPSIRKIFDVGRLYLDLIYPPSCLICSGELPNLRSIDLCSSCLDAMQGDNRHWCRKCGMPKEPHRADKRTCTQCAKQSFAFDDVIIWGQYQGVLREAVIAGKKQFHEPLTMTMGRLLADRIAEEQVVLPDVITFVPSHWRRRFGRRTVPSATLAKPVGRRLRRPVKQILRPVRATAKQAMLPAAERSRNISGAFAVRKRYRCEGKHVLVVDDVMTTGATFNEIAGVLKRAGAASVCVAATARGTGIS
ncbi:MAG: ComF family protein [Pirellulaceae bacterium]